MCDICYLIAKYSMLSNLAKKMLFLWLTTFTCSITNIKIINNWDIGDEWRKVLYVSELWVGLQVQFSLFLSLRIHVCSKEFNSIPLIRYSLFHSEYQWVNYSLVPSQKLKPKYCYIHLTTWICTTFCSFLW